jgi:hypothetical protein
MYLECVFISLTAVCTLLPGTSVMYAHALGASASVGSRQSQYLISCASFAIQFIDSPTT